MNAIFAFLTEIAIESKLLKRPLVLLDALSITVKPFTRLTFLDMGRILISRSDLVVHAEAALKIDMPKARNLDSRTGTAIDLVHLTSETVSHTVLNCKPT